MGELRDIVHRNLMTTRRLSGEALNAGYAVRASGAAETVVYTENATCDGYPFEGVTLDSVPDATYLSIAVAPSEVYVNSTGTIAAGKYVTLGETDGTVMDAAINVSYGGADEVIVGHSITAAASNVVKIKLMSGFNNISG